MKSHSFIGKDITKPCTYLYDLRPTLNETHLCSRSFFEHSVNAECESCDYKGNDVELHLNSKMLLCDECRDKQAQALLDSLTVPNEVRDKKLSAQRFNKEIEVVAMTPIRHSGDFYNAIVVSHMDLKRMIADDESITDKHYAFQDALALRYRTVCDALFPIEEQAYKLNLEKVVIAKTMREFGEELRKDIRDRMKADDINYVPPTPKIVPKPKLAKKDPFENLVEVLAKQKGISNTEARLMIQKGMGSPKVL